MFGLNYLLLTDNVNHCLRNSTTPTSLVIFRLSTDDELRCPVIPCSTVHLLLLPLPPPDALDLLCSLIAQ